jgi:hypothetical protein
VRDFFKGSEYEVSYGDVMLGPALFQDDVSRLCDDPVSAQMGNDRMEAMAETKLLDFNMDKSCLIIIGKKSARSKLKKEVEQNPPLLKSQFVKQNLTNIRPCSNDFYFNCEGSSMISHSFLPHCDISQQPLDGSSPNFICVLTKLYKCFK